MISKATKEYDRQTAQLHQQTINEGFLPKLGKSFLVSLYRFFIKKELVLVYLEEKQVLGFVSCAISSLKIIRRFLVACPAGVMKLVFAILKNPKVLKSIFETWHAPSSSSEKGTAQTIPDTELLSIAVDPASQQKGIGFLLLNALEDELKKRGIKSYKVVAGEKLAGANTFYLKNGFVLVKQIKIHGDETSNVYVKNISELQ